MVLLDNFKVDAPHVKYEETAINATYDYQHTEVERSADGQWVVKPQTTKYEFKTDTRVPKLG
jgi:myo-inositol-1-phosphate synthase